MSIIRFAGGGLCHGIAPMRVLITAVAAALVSGAAIGSEPRPSPVTPELREVAPGVLLLPGAILPGRGPDGNTVVLTAPDGLIVVDTGRHAWHSDDILALAERLGRPVAAVVNTHWHLDHSSGNRRIKARYPAALLYATNAVDRALGEGGFLSRELARAPSLLESADLTDAQKEEVSAFVETMDHSETLRADVVVSRSGRMRIATRRHLRAVFQSDPWSRQKR